MESTSSDDEWWNNRSAMQVVFLFFIRCYQHRVFAVSSSFVYAAICHFGQRKSSLDVYIKLLRLLWCIEFSSYEARRKRRENSRKFVHRAYYDAVNESRKNSFACHKNKVKMLLRWWWWCERGSTSWKRLMICVHVNNISIEIIYDNLSQFCRDRRSGEFCFFWRAGAPDRILSWRNARISQYYV